MKQHLIKDVDGGAVVETAILMLILVPLLLYSAFSGEAGLHLIETQEQVVAALWDFSTYPYRLEKTPGDDISSPELIDTISMPNRIQYVDHDSSFSNLALFQGNPRVRAEEEKYRTEAFVFATHCDANNNDCSDNRPQNYEGTNVHEVACVMEDEAVGVFLEGKVLESRQIAGITVNLSGVGAVRAKSKGGLVKCQAKARLKNYLLPETFLPEFGSVKLYGGERYKKADGAVRDGKNVVQTEDGGFSDIVVRHRFVILTDTWGLIEPVSEHQDSELAFTPELRWPSIDNLFPKRTHFQEMTNLVRNAGVFLLPILPVLSYSGMASQERIAIVTAVPDVGDIIRPLNSIVDLIGIPNIMSLYMVAHYASHAGASHSGSGINAYKYIPDLDASGWSGLASSVWGLLSQHDSRPKYFTTPFYDGVDTKYNMAYNSRGGYYMAATQSNANN